MAGSETRKIKRSYAGQIFHQSTLGELINEVQGTTKFNASLTTVNSGMFQGSTYTDTLDANGNVISQVAMISEYGYNIPFYQEGDDYTRYSNGDIHYIDTANIDDAIVLVNGISVSSDEYSWDGLYLVFNTALTPADNVVVNELPIFQKLKTTITRDTDGSITAIKTERNDLVELIL